MKIKNSIGERAQPWQRPAPTGNGSASLQEPSHESEYSGIGPPSGPYQSAVLLTVLVRSWSVSLMFAVQPLSWLLLIFHHSFYHLTLNYPIKFIFCNNKIKSTEFCLFWGYLTSAFLVFVFYLQPLTEILIVSHLAFNKCHDSRVAYLLCHLSAAALPSPLTSRAPHRSYIIPLTTPNQPPEHTDNKTHLLPQAIHPPLTHLFSQSDKCDLRTAVGQEFSPSVWLHSFAPWA